MLGACLGLSHSMNARSWTLIGLKMLLSTAVKKIKFFRPFFSKIRATGLGLSPRPISCGGGPSSFSLSLCAIASKNYQVKYKSSKWYVKLCKKKTVFKFDSSHPFVCMVVVSQTGFSHWFALFIKIKLTVDSWTTSNLILPIVKTKKKKFLQIGTY